MTLAEIARCLYKRNHADHAEYIQALNAYNRLSAVDQQAVEQLAIKYR